MLLDSMGQSKSNNFIYYLSSFVILSLQRQEEGNSQFPCHFTRNNTITV